MYMYIFVEKPPPKKFILITMMWNGYYLIQSIIPGFVSLPLCECKWENVLMHSKSQKNDSINNLNPTRIVKENIRNYVNHSQTFLSQAVYININIFTFISLQDYTSSTLQWNTNYDWFRLTCTIRNTCRSSISHSEKRHRHHSLPHEAAPNATAMTACQYGGPKPSFDVYAERWNARRGLSRTRFLLFLCLSEFKQRCDRCSSALSLSETPQIYRGRASGRDLRDFSSKGLFLL